MHTAETAIIRPAERKDCDAIFNLIRELAIYEKMEEQVKTNAKDLERDAFDSNPPFFRCLVAEMPKSDSDNTQNDSGNGEVVSTPTVIGYALYFYKYSTWEGKAIHLEDFYITPKYRQGGLGTRIIKELAKIALDGGFNRLTLECLDWNETAMNFYKKHNAVNITERDGFHVFRFEKDTLPKLAGY